MEENCQARLQITGIFVFDWADDGRLLRALGELGLLMLRWLPFTICRVKADSVGWSNNGFFLLIWGDKLLTFWSKKKKQTIAHLNYIHEESDSLHVTEKGITNATIITIYMQRLENDKKSIQKPLKKSHIKAIKT